jgi:tetratricopeptide (TPR) repeat protein
MTVLFGKKKIEGKTAEEYEDAIRCYDKALKIYPNHESAKNNKEIAEEKLKEQQRTGKEKEKSLQRNLRFYLLNRIQNNSDQKLRHQNTKINRINCTSKNRTKQEQL